MRFIFEIPDELAPTAAARGAAGASTGEAMSGGAAPDGVPDSMVGAQTIGEARSAGAAESYGGAAATPELASTPDLDGGGAPEEAPPQGD